jgi:hypothetical protein
MNKEIFTAKENWRGSYYELAIELQSSHDDIQQEQALQALWSHPNLSGHWLNLESYGQDPDIFRISELIDKESNISYANLYGVFHIPEIHQQVACLSVVVREKNGSDWLDFCFPTVMLKQVFPLKSPLSHAENSWLKIVDKYLLETADIVYHQTPYDLALIGEEVSGMVHKVFVTGTEIENGGVLLSPMLWEKLSPNKVFEVMSSGLRWVPFAQ